ncbi:MAG: hypothetical protein IJ282_09035 [Lachnospiraceae bacterium]|nr:hypothetical protein [Lachnospiraceae bacterium]
MGLYEGIKDVARIVQQADNLELYKALLDLSAQALDMQAEIATLKKENEELKAETLKKKSIVRHKGIYITLEGEQPEIAYCSTCYGKDSKLIQMFDYDEECYQCPVCHTYAYKN